MSKTTKYHCNFKKLIIVSTFLHMTLFIGLIWSSLDEHIYVSAGNSKGSTIDAVMVYSNGPTQYYNQQQQQQQQQQSTIEHDKDQHEKQTQKLQRQQAKDNIIKVMADTKAKSNMHVKYEAEMAKKVTIAKQTACKEIAITPDIDFLFDDLSSDKKKLKTNGSTILNSSSFIKSNNTKNNDASDTDISNYAGQIKSAIEGQFYDASFYSGRICTLRIKLAPDGILLDIKTEGGDQELCNAAVAAAHQAKIPKPPSWYVYEIFKNTLLDFKP